MRSAGVLLPIFSLPSRYGIGTLGREAYRFLDFLVRAGMTYWQILPLTPTGYGDSPYQSVSAFAGNPYLIDLDDAASLLSVSLPDLYHLTNEEECRIDYEKQSLEKERALRTLFSRCEGLSGTEDYQRFMCEEASWLLPYGRFMAYRKKNGMKPWQEWTASDFSEEEEREADYQYFLQYLFFRQYQNLRRYANDRGIRIIGDMPLYVSLDSADVWEQRDLFLIDESGMPYEVAGVPPDLFSEDGQKWGNPLYEWKRMEEDGFSWWKRRIAHMLKMYDSVRIDHFIGLVNYYAIPASSLTAREGEWRKAPGEKLLESLHTMSDSLIAEDLGVVNEEVIRVRDRFCLPGMKILQFAFSGDSQNPFLPYCYEKNSIVYGGTHDNETLLGYFSGASEEELSYACRYLGIETKDPALVAKAIIRAGYASVSDTVIMSMQDLMGLDNRARINTPSTVSGNWQYRLPYDWEDKVDARELKDLAKLYGRLRSH